VPVTLPDSRVIRRAIGVVVLLLGIGLFVWAAWLYHLASVADTTDETAGFYVGVGSVVLALGFVTAFIGVHYVRRGRRQDESLGAE
jgi:uncharacterized membrane protein